MFEEPINSLKQGAGGVWTWKVGPCSFEAWYDDKRRRWPMDTKDHRGMEVEEYPWFTSLEKALSMSFTYASIFSNQDYEARWQEAPRRPKPAPKWKRTKPRRGGGKRS